MSISIGPLVQSLAGAINEYDAANPSVVAYELLELGGDTPEPLSDLAAERWSKVLAQSPDDPFAAHHLAVIHHGLAYQLHADSNRQKQAIEHWKTALQMWSRVITREEFWDHLQSLWRERHEKGKGDLLAERLLKVDLAAIRKQLPYFLLDVHVSILQTVFPDQLDLASEHLRLVRDAQFPEVVRQRALRNVYHALAGGAVQSLLEDLQTKKALALIESYLKIDPNHPQALADGLKVAAKHAERLKADGAAFAQQRHSFKAAIEWADRLQKHLDVSGDLLLADAARTFFVEYSRMLSNHGVNQANVGKAAEGIGVVFEALEPAARAIKLEKGGQEARTFYIHLCEQMSPLSAICEGHEGRALQALTAANQLLPNQPVILARLAYLAAVNGNSAEYQRLLHVAERCQQASPDHKAAAVISELRQKGLGVGSIKLINQAAKAMEGKNFSSALDLLGRAEAKDPGNPLTLILKTICYLNQGNPVAGLTAFRAADAANRIRPDPQATEIVENLRSQLKMAGML